MQLYLSARGVQRPGCMDTAVHVRSTETDIEFKEAVFKEIPKVKSRRGLQDEWKTGSGKK